MGFRDDFAGTQLGTSWFTSVKPSTTPNSLAVDSSTAILVSGVTAGQTRFISFPIGNQRGGVIFDFRMRISARQANQHWFMGLFNEANPLQATQFARFRLNGAGAVTDSFLETQSSTDTGGTEGIAVIVALPATAATFNTYRINLTNVNCAFSAGGDLLPPSTALITRSLHIPSISSGFSVIFGVTNANPGPAASTSLTVDLLAVTDTIL